MKKWILILLVLVLAALAWFTLLPGKPLPAPVWVTLPDGSKMRILAVTYGTNHVVGSQVAQMTARFPMVMQFVLQRLFGQRAVPLQQRVTTTPKLMVWVDHQTNGPAPVGFPSVVSFEAFLGDTNNFISGAEADINPLGMSWVEPLEFNAFPRRSREISLNIFQQNNTGKASLCNTLSFVNPQFRHYPVWQAEALPATKRAGDVEVSLLAVETGYNDNTTSQSLPGGGIKLVYGTNRLNGRNHTAVNLTLKPLGNTNEVWQVTGVEVSDATGNVANNSGLSWNGGIFGFSFMPSLWPAESAWKLKLEIKRTDGFRPEEIFTFQKVPLGELEHTNTVGWTTNVAGITVTLQSIFRRAPITKSSWSSSDLSAAKFTNSPLPAGTHLDLLRVVSNSGKTNRSSASSSGSERREYGFRDIPLEAKTADFVFAVQQSRIVEFTVKPEPPKTMVDTNEWRR